MFTYLSETPDAVEYAASMNIKRSNAVKTDITNLHEDFDDLMSSLDHYAVKKSQSKKECYLIQEGNKFLIYRPIIQA